MHDLTASIVTYKNDLAVLRKAILCFLNTSLNVRLYIVDNSPSSEVRDICQDGRIDYIFNNKNLGFGRGHNIAIKRSVGMSRYHLVLNPDIFFERGTLEKLCGLLDNEKDIGLVMPKICDFKGSTQYLCKLLPTPFDLILRRTNSEILRIVFRNRMERYVLKNSGYDKLMDIPHLSGCFMLIKRDVFEKMGIFDERFFMYLEDVDFSRRIHKHYRTVYYPEVVIYHEHAKHSYADFKALKYHVFSAINYFNKWGWFFDEERQRVNSIILKKYL